jgi:hypothetical protein
MSEGTKWRLPGGHEALEVSGSTTDVLRVCILVPGWGWLKPPQEVARVLCELAPMRYFGGEVPSLRNDYCHARKP